MPAVDKSKKCIQDKIEEAIKLTEATKEETNKLKSLITRPKDNVSTGRDN